MPETIATIAGIIGAIVPATEAGVTIAGIGTITVADVAATAIVAASAAYATSSLTQVPTLSPSAAKQNVRQAVPARRRYYARVGKGGPIR